MRSVAEPLALLRRHLLPTFGHSLANSLAYSPVHSPARMAMPTATKTKASEEDPAKRQQSDGLPEGDKP